MTHDAGPEPGEPGASPADVREPAVPMTFGPTVTIFFSDIRGFTEYTDAHGDAAAFRMLQFHNSMVQEQIALYGGHIVKRLGDSFMVSFDAARNAMACGIGIQKSLALYNEKESGARINIGIGINIGEPIRDADDFFGGSVNLAARICAAAGAGEILVSDGVRLIVGKIEGTDYADRGYFDLKGFHEPQHLYAVDWTGLGASASASPLATPALTPTARTAAGQTAGVSARPARSRLPIIAGAVAVVLALLVGGVFLLRENGFRPLARAPIAKPEAAKPTQAVVTPPPAPTSGQAAVAPPAPSPQVAKPGVSGPAAQAAPAAKPGAAAQASPAANPGSSAEAAPSPAATERLLRADDFSDPARGLFPNSVQGIGSVSGEGMVASAYQGSYAYQDGVLVARIVGDHPGGERTVFGRSFLAVDKLFDDVAVEVRARGTGSPDAVRYGMQYVVGPGEFFTYTVFPGNPGDNLSYTVNQQVQVVSTGRTASLHPVAEENLLRIEVRGATARLFANGQEIARVQHEALGKRPGQAGLIVGVVRPLTNRTAEVQFDDFKVFALAGDR